MSTLLGPPSWATLPADDEQAVRLPCQHLDWRWWFSDRPAELELAKGHCRQCPMQTPCLIGALARHEPCGVWGGEIFDNGVTIEHKRPRGRPRKRPEVTIEEKRPRGRPRKRPDGETNPANLTELRPVGPHRPVP